MEITAAGFKVDATTTKTQRLDFPFSMINAASERRLHTAAVSNYGRP